MDIQIPRPGVVSLTERDVKILQLCANGLSTKEIGKELQLSDRTVETYFDDLRTKLNAKHRPHLIAIALRNKAIK